MWITRHQLQGSSLQFRLMACDHNRSRTGLCGLHAGRVCLCLFVFVRFAYLRTRIFGKLGPNSIQTQSKLRGYVRLDRVLAEFGAQKKILNSELTCRLDRVWSAFGARLVRLL